MADQDKTNEQLVEELQTLRQRVVLLEGIDSERKRAEEALAKQHRTLSRLLQANDYERQMIAYEIHDGLAQQLAGAIMQIQAFEHLKDEAPAAATKAHDAGLATLRQACAETRRLIAGLRSPILDESGVVEAVADLVNDLRSQDMPPIEFTANVDFDRLVPVLENTVYRICQEALQNACQHSRSARIRLSLVQQKDRIRTVIRDWGIGFDTQVLPQYRYGLEGIRQRARIVGGKCKIWSKPGMGTRIVVDLPLVKREADA